MTDEPEDAPPSVMHCSHCKRPVIQDNPRTHLSENTKVCKDCVRTYLMPQLYEFWRGR